MCDTLCHKEISVQPSFTHVITFHACMLSRTVLRYYFVCLTGVCACVCALVGVRVAVPVVLLPMTQSWGAGVLGTRRSTRLTWPPHHLQVEGPNGFGRHWFVVELWLLVGLRLFCPTVSSCMLVVAPHCIRSLSVFPIVHMFTCLPFPSATILCMSLPHVSHASLFSRS